MSRAVGQADEIESRQRFGTPLGAAVAGVFRCEGDVFGRAERRDEVVGLEDEAQMFRACPRAGAVRELRHVTATDHEAGPRSAVEVGLVEQAEDVHEGRLAGPGRAHDRDHLAGFDRDVDSAQGLNAAVLPSR